MFRPALSAALLPFLALPAFAEEATAELADAEGKGVGSVTLTQTPNGVVIEADLRNLPAGAHGFHIHETGVCSGHFASAGGHFAPDGNGHGYLAEDGAHAGDLPNIHVSADGAARADYFTDRVSLSDGEAGSLFDADGSAVIVHAQADSYGDEAGAGDRIACGVIDRG